MVDSPDPIDPRERFTLGVGDRDDRHLPEFFVKRNQVRKVEPSMESRYAGNLLAPAQGEVQIVDMKVNEVELFRPAENPLDHQIMMGDWIDALWVKPQCFVARGN